MYTSKNDAAVSPVIGVILVVAITVILAAVVAAFAFGFMGNMYKAKIVSATAKQLDADTILVTYQGGQDAKTCTGLTITATPSTAHVAKTQYTTTIAADASGVVPLGSTAKIDADSGYNFAGRDHVIVTAHFSDTPDVVILDSFI